MNLTRLDLAKSTTALATCLLLSSCAAFNTGQLVLSRHTTVGSELIDLQAAHEKGAISDREYEQAKEGILEWTDQADVEAVFEDDGWDSDD